MILVEQEAPIATITINRPEVLNSLSHELILNLSKTIREWSAKKDLRLLVLTGSGDRAFVGGVDVRTFLDLDQDSAEQFITDLHRCFLAIRQSEMIVIASINGFALGAGLEMIASCDLRVASDRARFGMPEVKVGMPSVIEAAYFPRLIGLGRAAELLYTGKMIDAQEAERVGLINQVVPHGKLKEATLNMAEEILANGPRAVILQKKLISQWMDMNFSDSIQAGIKMFRECYKTNEPTEGAKAFLEKRRPSFMPRKEK
jgi:enoyl-CoA hydratase/carnithine racemase